MTGWLLGKLILLAVFGGALGLLVWWLRRRSDAAFREAMASFDRTTAEAVARAEAVRVAGSQPALLLTLRLRSPLNLGDVVASSVRLAEALSKYERDLGGEGLTPAREPVPTDEPNVVRVVLTPVSAAGAGERLAKVAQAVTEAAKGADAGPAVAVTPLAGVGRMFDALSAAVVRDSDQEPVGVGA